MEVEKPSAEKMMASMTAGAVGHPHVYDLALSEWHNLNDVRFSETDDAKISFMTHSNRVGSDAASMRNHGEAGMKAFLLQGSYEGKATKWTEDVCKARIEGRFCESERESEAWALRNVHLHDISMNIFTSVFEEGIDDLIEGRKEPAPIRIVVDREKGTKSAPLGHYGVEVVANIESLPDPTPRYRLEVAGLRSTLQSHIVSCNDLLPIFAQKGMLTNIYGFEGCLLTCRS